MKSGFAVLTCLSLCSIAQGQVDVAQDAVVEAPPHEAAAVAPAAPYEPAGAAPVHSAPDYDSHATPNDAGAMWTMPQEGVFEEGGYGPNVAPHYNMPSHHYSGWYRPRAFGRPLAVRCGKCDPFRPRGYGRLFARPDTSRRLDYSPYQIRDWRTVHGPSYYALAPDQRCDNCDKCVDKPCLIKNILTGTPECRNCHPEHEFAESIRPVSLPCLDRLKQSMTGCRECQECQTCPPVQAQQQCDCPTCQGR